MLLLPARETKVSVRVARKMVSEPILPSSNPSIFFRKSLGHSKVFQVTNYRIIKRPAMAERESGTGESAEREGREGTAMRQSGVRLLNVPSEWPRRRRGLSEKRVRRAFTTPPRFSFSSKKNGRLRVRKRRR